MYEHDVSYVDVLMPGTAEFVRVPALDAEYCEGLNRHTHRLIRQQVRARFGDEWTQQQLRDAKAEIQQMIGQAMRDHKAAKRKKAASLKLRDSEDVLGMRAEQALEGAMAPRVLDDQPEFPLHASAVLLPNFNVSEQARRSA